MKSYLVAPEAEDDLRHIWRYLLEEAGHEVADRIENELLDAFKVWPMSRAKATNVPTLRAAMCCFFSVY